MKYSLLILFLAISLTGYGQVNLNQLQQGGASTNDFIKWNGTRYAPSATADGNGIYSGSGNIFANAVATVGTSDSFSISGINAATTRAMVNIIALATSNEPNFLRLREGGAFLNFGRGDTEFNINTNQSLVITTTDILSLSTDSLQLSSAPTRLTGASIMVRQGNGTLGKLVGISNGDVIKWNGTSWSSAVDEGMADFDNGISNNENSGVVRLGNTYMNTPYAPFTSNRKVNISTFNFAVGTTADSVLFVVNGTNTKVGIGTADPVAKLDITAKTTDAITGLLGLNLHPSSGFKYGMRISSTDVPTANRFIILNTDVDSLRIQEAGADYTMQAFGSDLFIASSEILDLGALRTIGGLLFIQTLQLLVNPCLV